MPAGDRRGNRDRAESGIGKALNAHLNPMSMSSRSIQGTGETNGSVDGGAASGGPGTCGPVCEGRTLGCPLVALPDVGGGCEGGCAPPVPVLLLGVDFCVDHGVETVEWDLGVTHGDVEVD